MYKLRRRPQLSQNFLKSRILVRKLVRNSSIGQNDLVLEIGPGEGTITQELLEIVQRVIAIEIDSRLYRFIRRKFSHCQNLILYRADALRIKLPSAPYKVFANIPFSIEGKLIRRLLHSQNPPISSHQLPAYRQFITLGFTSGRRLNQNLKPLISPEALNRIAHQLGFSFTATPGDLTFPQWLALFSKLRYHS